MTNTDKSLILVGMPGAGKSTVGLLLAKELVKAFVDTDLLIQTKEDQALQDIIIERGYMALRQVEENILLGMNCPNHIIATGGSAVYSRKGMQHLMQFGRVVFLKVPLTELQARINNEATRGIAKPASQSFTELFTEREALYLQYADVTINAYNKTPAEIVAEVMVIHGIID